MMFRALIMAAMVVGMCGWQTLSAAEVTFHFAAFGMSYSAALFGDDLLVGREITNGRIYLQVESFPGSDASTFVTDIVLPINPFPGSDPSVVLSGDDLGWSGAGVFDYFLETDRFNGTFLPRRYGAETFGEGFDGRILDGRIVLEVPDLLRGDFDNDGDLDANDINLLTFEGLNGGAGRAYDLDQDGTVDQADRIVWVEELRKSYFGDANLDGEFGSGDFVTVFAAGEYEDTIEANSSWATGDWDGNSEFDSSDLVWALQRGGFEAGPRAAVAAVPEPALTWGALVTLVTMLCHWQRGELQRSPQRAMW